MKNYEFEEGCHPAPEDEIDGLILDKAEEYGIEVDAVVIEDCDGDDYIQYRLKGFLSEYEAFLEDEAVFLAGYVVDGEQGRIRKDEELAEYRQSLQENPEEYEDDWSFMERDW